MAFQVLNDPNAGANSRAFSDALSTGLQNLVSHKLQGMEKQRNMQELHRAFPDLDPGALGFLSNLPPKEQMQYLQNFASGMENFNQQEQEQRAQQEHGLQALLGQQQNMQQRPQVPYAPGFQGQKQQQYGGQEQQQIAQQIQQAQQQLVQQPTLDIAKRPTLLSTLKTSAKLGDVEERKLAYQMKKDALKETKEIRKDLFAKKRAAEETLEAIDRFDQLEKEGLPGAGYVEFLKESGIDIPALIGAPAEEYNKIAANFVRNAKAMFGARLTDTDLNQFLKTVPSLSNSPEGRKRINANLKRLANLDKASVESYNEIVKKNGGYPPLDLDVQLDEKLDKKRDAIYNQFKKDLSKEVPEGESALVTGILAGAGKLIGGATSGGAKGALKGAALGAGWGKYGGGPGAAIGGGLGALAGLTGIL